MQKNFKKNISKFQKFLEKKIFILFSGKINFNFGALRRGLLTYIESRIKVNEPVKNSFKYLDVILKNMYYIQRMLSASIKENDDKKIQSDVIVNRTDSIGFYESLEGRKQKFPSMVDKIGDMENHKLDRMRKNYVKLEKKSKGDWLQSDFEVFKIKVSPRTKRRIKRNKEDASQLKQTNFYQKYYLRMIEFEKTFYTAEEEDNIVNIF